MKRTTIFTSIAAALLLSATIAISQPFGGMGPGPGTGMGMGPRWAAADVTTYVDARLADIKARLSTNTSQEGLWQDFAAQMKEQAQRRQGLRAQMWTGDANGPDRMALHAQVMQQRAAQMQVVATALDRLYAGLTAEQRTVADQLLAPRFGPGR